MNIFILYIGHFLADFTFQSLNISKKNKDSLKYLICHELIYAVTFAGVIFPLVKFGSAIFSYIAIIVSHFLFDWMRRLVDQKSNNKAINFVYYVVDQIFHIFVLTIIYYAFNLHIEQSVFSDMLGQWVHFYNVVIYCLMFIILWDPTAVFIRKLFEFIFDDNSYAPEENDPRVGRVIGKLERIIISVLILCNQIGAVGFVLTAKSIARYKQLEDKRFAEKYLVGTLASVLVAFIVTILLKQLLE